VFCFAIGSILYIVPKKLVVPVINQKEEKEDRTAEPDVFYRIVKLFKRKQTLSIRESYID
jgi:hypothetical protein